MSNRHYNRTKTNPRMRANPLMGSSSSNRRKQTKAPKITIDPSLRGGGTGKPGTDISKVVRGFSKRRNG